MAQKLSQIGPLDNDACPKCGAVKQVDFDCFEMVDGAGGFYEATCGKCGFEGRQWQRCEFECWQELSEDGQYVDLKGGEPGGAKIIG